MWSSNRLQLKSSLTSSSFSLRLVWNVENKTESKREILDSNFVSFLHFLCNVYFRPVNFTANRIFNVFAAFMRLPFLPFHSWLVAYVSYSFLFLVECSLFFFAFDQRDQATNTIDRLEIWDQLRFQFKIENFPIKRLGFSKEKFPHPSAACDLLISKRWIRNVNSKVGTMLIGMWRRREPRNSKFSNHLCWCWDVNDRWMTTFLLSWYSYSFVENVKVAHSLFKTSNWFV